jgi:hypothetical protein
MNLTQFLRACSGEQVSYRGALFDSEEDASTCLVRMSEYNPEQIGCLILYKDWDEYECWKIIQEKYSAYHCYWWSILFASAELAKSAEERIRNYFNTQRVVSRNNELLVDKYLDETELYYAISSSSVIEMPGQCLFVPGIPDEDWWFNESFCWVPIPFEEKVSSSKPQILIRDLDAFEDGEDRTVWIDAAQEVGTIVQKLAWWLYQSPNVDVIAHCWCIVDTYNFPPKYEPEELDDLVEVSYVATMWEKYGNSWWVYFSKFRYTKKPVFDHPSIHYCGCYASADEYFQVHTVERSCYTVIRYQQCDYIYLVVE